MLQPKKIHTRNLITKKIPAARKFPTPTITFLMVRPLPTSPSFIRIQFKILRFVGVISTFYKAFARF